MTPLLGELRQGDLVGNMEALTRSAAQAAADITRLQGEVIGMPTSTVFGLMLCTPQEPWTESMPSEAVAGLLCRC